MSKYATADIRNLVFIGGPGTGKTTLCDAILNLTGKIGRIGSIGDGTTVSDWEPDEQDKGHSIRLGVLNTDRKGCHYNLLDAPGYPDFVGETAAALTAAETAVLCVNAGQGVTFPSLKIWNLAGKARRARCVVVTHLDQHEVDFGEFVEQIGEALGARFLPLIVVEGSGAKFSDAPLVPLSGKAEGAAAELRDAVIEAVVEVDEDAMTRFLEDDAPPAEDEAWALLKRSMIEGECVPVFAVNSTDGAGVEAFLAAAKRGFPSPADGPHLLDVDGNEVTPDAPGTSAFVFKTIIDPYVGKLCVMRVVSGEIQPPTSLTLARTEKAQKLAHVEALQGKEHKEIESGVAGDIVAVAKVEELETSDSLVDAGQARVFAPLKVPKPMAARAISPVNHADDIKLSTTLRRAAAEDPAFSASRNEDTGELVAHGTSLMHLETQLRRIKERSGVELKVELPRVALKETIQVGADGHHRHKKQTGGRGQFAEVFLRVEPGERGVGLNFVDDTVGGSIPKNFLPAIEKGIVDVMSKGIIAGHTVVDVTVRVKDGKFHDVDSDEASFKMAGGRAFKDGFTKAKPVLLEPLVNIEVAVPSRFMGAITSDMTGRRGQISGMDSLGDIQIVKARAPERELLTYPTVLHSLTSGEGSFSAEFDDYEIVPPNVQQEIMAEFKPEDEE